LQDKLHAAKSAAGQTVIYEHVWKAAAPDIPLQITLRRQKTPIEFRVRFISSKHMLSETKDASLTNSKSLLFGSSKYYLPFIVGLSKLRLLSLVSY